MTTTRTGTPAPLATPPPAASTPDPPDPPDLPDPPDPRFAAYRSNHDRQVRDELIEDYSWLGRHCARSFRNKGEPTADLEQVAMVGLVKAVDRFEPARGFAFSTYAVPTIVGELRRHFRDRSWSLRVPRSAKERYLAVKAAADELQQVAQASPTVPEIADHAGLSVEETLEALEVGNAYRGFPLDVGDDPRSAERGPTLVDRIGRDDPGYAASEARTIVRELLTLLPTDVDRKVIELRFVDELSQSEIGARLGFSQVHISRLLRRNLQLMRRHLAASADPDADLDPDLDPALDPARV